MKTYALVSPARNEERYIETTIRAVVSQTIIPVKFVLVSDGSTDRTDDIAKKYASDYEFIQLVRLERQGKRNFGSKAFAIREGYSRLNEAVYDFVGFMDADIFFEPNFCEQLMNRLQANPRQGIGGGLVHEKAESDQWLPLKMSTRWSVSGPMQMFRRKCYEEIGGYLPLPKGGVDMIAEVMARMHGWEVKTFEDLKVFHFRPTGAASGNTLKANFRRGIMEYANGYHPLFQIARFFTWLTHQPLLLASLCRTAGYFKGLLTREGYEVPLDVVKYLRAEQIHRLRSYL